MGIETDNENESQLRYDQQAAYTTKHEMRFIDRLGSDGVLTRAEALRLYATALKRRTDWRGLDAPAVQHHLQTALRSEELVAHGGGITSFRHP